ncbi:imm11 family protein [Zavarzinia compransoris]|uniref:imm11 family protein n=1 Tax=Zavarzinia compransoris TaxID=1264899 RepID=UPI00105D827C|nr:DUF1629 domain-containing protein [Zavarzinia compransoris]TDP43512.1 hypothetical protein DES42_11179 [Zavarzinia compransoris]
MTTTKKTPCAWVSRAFKTTSLTRYIVPENYKENLEEMADVVLRNRQGIPLPSERFPKIFYGEYPERKIEKLPDLFEASGFWIISSRLLDIFHCFNMENTSFYKIKIFQHDNITPVDGNYYCINFGDRKETFLPEASPRARKIYPDKDIWTLNSAPKDDDIALAGAALDGADLWIEEPRFTRAFFLSDGLVTALRKAKLTRHFGLYRCRIHHRSDAAIFHNSII